jgi:DUF4097 and DUF4098 domain-containing protein YvlB
MKSSRIWAAAVALIGCAGIYAQLQDNRAKDLNCNDRGRRDQASHCEIREQTMAAVGRLTADPGKNGGVSIKGWLDNQVLVRAKIQTWAETDSEATALASQVRVDTNTGQVSASGPESQGRSGWAVSYEIFVPQTTDLNLKAFNGGISISDVRGRIEFSAKNGGVTLKRVAGDVAGSTMNGGVTIELAGNTWDGRQLEVSTTNGGVTLAVPERYSAHLRTETTNGGIHSDFSTPAPQTGSARPRNLEMNLGSGGPMIHVSTTNGGVTVKRM